MARILYGVHGTGHGHAVRALTIARHFPEHEFLFVSHGAGAAILQPEYPVVECPSLDTVIHQHRVKVAATISRTIQIWLRRRAILRQVLELMDRFQPEVALSDYEFFVPQAARGAGLPCLSLDHQHIITCCSHPLPWSQLPSYLATSWAVRFLFSQASHFLVTSFFRPPLKPKVAVKLVPPLLRESVLRRRPQDGEHVLAYQGFSTFARFLPFLQAIPRPVLVYGLNRETTEGNLRLKKNSEEGFLDDLASCQYVVCGGSHSLASEALFYGKPIISFPIKGAFEQFLNAFYVGRLGYGQYFTGLRPRPEIIPAFEAQLEHYRHRIRQERFCGNPEIFALVAEFINHQGLHP